MSAEAPVQFPFEAKSLEDFANDGRELGVSMVERHLADHPTSLSERYFGDDEVKAQIAEFMGVEDYDEIGELVFGPKEDGLDFPETTYGKNMMAFWGAFQESVNETWDDLR
jgi:hypothetical protein